MEISKIKEFISSLDVAYISTIGDDYPQTRALMNINNTAKFEYLKDVIKKEDKALYFMTNTSSRKIAQIRKNNKASVYFSDNLTFKDLLLCGTIKELDKKERDLFWHASLMMYYPKGKDGGDFSILKFTLVSYKVYAELAVKEGVLDARIK